MVSYSGNCLHCLLEVTGLDLFLVMFEDKCKQDVYRFICTQCMEFNEKPAGKRCIKMICKYSPDNVKVVPIGKITEAEIKEFTDNL